LPRFCQNATKGSKRFRPRRQEIQGVLLCTYNTAAHKNTKSAPIEDTEK
jgi:hypothetical protein